MDKDDPLLLENQLCFPLYACSREIVKVYRPWLDELGITYTQYITLMVLWEEQQISVKDLGARLRLDSGTLTPLLKKLEAKGYLHRQRSVSDERVVLACISRSRRRNRGSCTGCSMSSSACWMRRQKNNFLSRRGEETCGFLPFFRDEKHSCMHFDALPESLSSAIMYNCYDAHKPQDIVKGRGTCY